MAYRPFFHRNKQYKSSVEHHQDPHRRTAQIHKPTSKQDTCETHVVSAEDEHRYRSRRADDCRAEISTSTSAVPTEGSITHPAEATAGEVAVEDKKDDEKPTRETADRLLAEGSKLAALKKREEAVAKFADALEIMYALSILCTSRELAASEVATTIELTM